MAVTHGVGDLLVAKQHLDHANVFVLFQQVCCKCMAQRMQLDLLIDASLGACVVEDAVELSR